MANNTLNELQKEFLERFFAHENRFFLTGGAALVGFYLYHRQTEDIDLFTLEDEIERGFALVNEVAREMGADIESLQTSPDFRRLLLRRGDSAIVVDLVHEYVFQVDRAKRVVNGIFSTRLRRYWRTSFVPYCHVLRYVISLMFVLLTWRATRLTQLSTQRRKKTRGSHQRSWPGCSARSGLARTLYRLGVPPAPICKII